MTSYTITPLPQTRSDETEWLVTGGSADYTVRRNGRGEFRCTCPDMTKSHSGRRDLVRRAGGCKHCRLVIDSLNVEEMLQETVAS